MTFTHLSWPEDPWLNHTHQERSDSISHGLGRPACTLSTTLRVLVGLTGRSYDRGRNIQVYSQLICVLTLTQTLTRVALGLTETPEDTTLNPQ